MSSPDKVSKDHILATRTRSAAKTMVAPHPDDEDQSDDEEGEQEDQAPPLLDSEAFEYSAAEEEPQPSTSRAPTPPPRRQKKITKKKTKKNTAPEETDDDVPPLYSDRDSSPDRSNDRSNDRTKKGGGRSRAKTNKPAKTVSSITRRKKNKANVAEQSAEESTYETAIDSDVVPYHARRPNIRRKLTTKTRSRAEAVVTPIRRRHRAGGDSAHSPNRVSFDPNYQDDWDAYDSEGGYSEQEFTPNGSNIRPIQVIKEVDAPKFDGSNFRAFKLQFLTVAQLNGWTPAERAARLRCSLVGKAMEILSAADVDEWSDLRWLEEMDMRHGQNKAVCDVSNLILDMEKGNSQSSLAYADSLESVAQKSEMEKPQRDAICYTAFIHGLRNNRKMQRYVMRRDKGKNLSSAARCASWYEREMGVGDFDTSPAGTVQVDARTVIEKQMKSTVTISTDDKAASGSSGEAIVSLNPTNAQVAAPMIAQEPLDRSTDRPSDRHDTYFLKLSEKIDKVQTVMQKQMDGVVGRLDEGDRARQVAKERRQANWSRNNNQNYNNNNYQGNQQYGGNRNGGNQDGGNGNGGNGNGGRRNYNNKKKKNKQNGNGANDDAASSETAVKENTPEQA